VVQLRLGRTVGPADACSMAGVMSAFKKAKQHSDLLVELVATDAFRYDVSKRGAMTASVLAS